MHFIRDGKYFLMKSAGNLVGTFSIHSLIQQHILIAYYVLSSYRLLR